ncbi:uncharacterized protein BT62DRAFT_458358 [Guyanagaster necrorhizus]|uniref:Reverse transcriptase n=1 Tax=Guyanagaster necrorhizus TaxID=856835 RepID=A0A9P7VKP6_9AGAR|nr:uncharacterized protein BT62DRAFT_458358 [Guyanagaster necrorhizus MCA 3950]KAG7442125.1 hypothetical protein BT62DRAFT_458358 [Guyanagaster necrorhizus MCA 3950]
MIEGSDISFPKYATSLAKKEMMDKQIDTCYAQGILEPFKSPWGVPVGIAYQNGKPQFCVNYLP